MPTIAEVREKFPQYQDMSDTDLAGALHQKFYSDLPRDQFDAKIGLDPTPAKPADKGMLHAAGHGLLQGASFNLSDEIAGAHAAGPQFLEASPISKTVVGGVRAGLNALTGLDPSAGEAYAQGRDQERAEIKSAKGNHPYVFGGSELAGGLAIPVGSAATGANLLARSVRGALTGAGVGAAYGVGGGETATERAGGGLTGALFGGALGGAAPAVVEGVIQGASALGRPIANTIRSAVNPEGEASRRVATALDRDFRQQGPQFTPEEAAVARASGAPTAVVDAGGETTRALARSAANTSPEARQALTSLTDERFASQNDRAANFVQRLTGANADNPATIEGLQSAARRANRPAYERAYSSAPAVWTPELEQIAQAPAVQDAIRQATRSGANRAAADGFQPVRNPFQADETGALRLATNPDGSQALPSLQFWDHVKRNLDDQFNKLQRAGENSAARDVGDLRAQLLNHLDQNVPAYRSARAGAAEAFGAQDALEAGSNFVTSKMDNAEAQRAFGRMVPQERELFRQGFASTLINQISEMGDRRTILNQIAQSPAARERLDLALGPERARMLETYLRVEGIIDRARPAVSGNSTTARQLTELGLAGSAGGIAGGFDVSNPKAYGTAALVYGLARGRNAVNENVARRVGEMLAGNDPNVVQRGLEMIARNASIFNRLRALDGFGSRASGQQAPTSLVMGGTMPARAQDEKQ